MAINLNGMGFEYSLGFCFDYFGVIPAGTPFGIVAAANTSVQYNLGRNGKLSFG
jgi:hypothetical protein